MAEIQNKLEDGRRSASGPKPGSENDLMATLDGSVQQSDVDALAAQAGLIIEIRPGSIFVNKDVGDQNFVIIRSEDIFIPAGGSKTLGGLYVACVDGARGIPTEGTGFDLGPSLSDWRGIEAAQFLLKLVKHVDEQERFCATSGYVPQSAVWRITSSTPTSKDPNVDAFLQAAGINLGDRILDFPHMTNPNAADSSTSSVTPLELFVLDLASPAGNILKPGETVEVTGAVNAPVDLITSTVITWSLEPPTGSAATLTNLQGDATFFTMDMRGIYQVLMQAEVTDTLANTFTLETVDLFTAADAYTATFETGILEPEGPFHWETSEEHPWIVTDHESHSGVFSAASAKIGDNGMTTLTAKIEQVTADTMSFSYKVSSQVNHDFFLFSIDGQVQGSWSGLRDWRTFSIALPAGKHTAVWTYEKDDFLFHSRDRVWIDDVFFPKGAIFTSVEGQADNVLPETYQLLANYPNPFNPSTTITYAIPQAQHVKLIVYNALGQQVATLVEGRRRAGQYQVRFDAQGLSNGIYYYELRAGTFTERKAMVLLK
ncbi:MAG: T9SS type A sorting domain-containing protein [bacterium]